MGISIHYSGSIAKPEFLPRLIEEIKDIAIINQWNYTEFERTFPESSFDRHDYDQNIYGISLAPQECEPVFISFLSNGRMSSPFHLSYNDKTGNQDEQTYLYMLAVKTQFAGVETHQSIIHLFRYLKTKYLEDFTLIDEGKYWETNDLELLKENFTKNAGLIRGLSAAIEHIPRHPEESLEDYMLRLMKFIRDET